MATLWHGRFEGGSAEALQALNDSLGFDRRMFREDLAGSRAHVRMLARVGLMSVVDSEAVLVALDTVEVEMSDGSFAFAVGDDFERQFAHHSLQRMGECFTVVHAGLLIAEQHDRIVG